MANLQAFHNDPLFKAKMVAAAIAHREADRYIRGSYCEMTAGHFRGCSIGCAIESVIGPGSDDPVYGDHRSLPDLMGLPVWLGYLQDAVFEQMGGDYTTWNERLLAAIPVGVDLSLPFHRIMSRIQREIVVSGTEINERVAALHDRAARGDSPSQEEWSAARYTARSAARYAARSTSARAAARSAAEAAARIDEEWFIARRVVRSAAQSAAESAAQSAESAAQSDAEEAAVRSAARSAAEAAAGAVARPGERSDDAWSVISSIVQAEVGR